MILLHMLARTEFRNLILRKSLKCSLRVGLIVVGFIVKTPSPPSAESWLEKSKTPLLMNNEGLSSIYDITSTHALRF